MANGNSPDKPQSPGPSPTPGTGSGTGSGGSGSSPRAPADKGSKGGVIPDNNNKPPQ
jgi:hypothetical protein